MPRKSKNNKSNSKFSTKSISNTLKKFSSMPGTSSDPQGPNGSLTTRIKSIALIFTIIIGIIGLIINIYAIFWIFKLEAIPDCKCSNTWMRLYIKYYLYFQIPVMIITLLLNIFLYSNNLTITDIKSSLFGYFQVFAGFVNIFGLINIIISIIFINKLKEFNCECSEDIRREIYYIYNIVGASIICIIILILLMSVPFAVLRLR
jgi:hypothetical protein